MRLPSLPPPLSALILAALWGTLTIGPTNAQSVCHDQVWDPDEFCGYDAYVTTGIAEMNHDCAVDIMDLHMFANEFGRMAPDLGGDLNGDGRVDLVDLLLLRPSWGLLVPGCTPGGMRPDTLQGSIALSFSSDPATIVPSMTLAAGEWDTLFCVIDDYDNFGSVEYAIETSPNLKILVHAPWIESAVHYAAFLQADPDSHHSYRGCIPFQTVPQGPVILGAAFVYHVDETPGWIHLTDFQMPDWPQGFLRWNSPDGDRRYFFEETSHAEVQGTAAGVGSELVPDTSARPVLRGASPNPFRPATTISFDLDSAGEVELQIRDLFGRAVRLLVIGNLDAGRHEFVWDGRDENGRHLASGTYFYALRIDGTVAGMRKVVIVR